MHRVPHVAAAVLSLALNVSVGSSRPISLGTRVERTNTRLHPALKRGTLFLSCANEFASISPCGVSRTMTPNSSATRTFTITNDSGPGPLSFTIACAKSGVMTSCSVSPSSVSLRVGVSTNVTVTYGVGAAAGSGTGSITVTGPGADFGASINVTVPTYSVAVSPKNGTAVVPAQHPYTQNFTVQNTGSASETYYLRQSCGSHLSCILNTTRVSLASGASTFVPMTITPGTGGVVETASLHATDSAYATATDSGFVRVSTPFLVVSTAAMNNDDQDMQLCAAACFAATYAQSTAPYYSLGQPRSVTLVYHGDRVAVRPFIEADVSLGPGAPAIQQFWLQAKVKWGTDWSPVTFLNGEQVLHFAGDGTQQVRLAGQFDASANPTRMYPLEIIVTAQYATSTEQYVDSTLKLMIVNERQSAIGSGWAVAGVQHLYPQSDGSALITDGTGSALYFATCGTGCFTAPQGDFSKLIASGSDTSIVYTRTYSDSSKVIFNYLGREVATTDRTGHGVVLSYDTAGRLVEISDPFRGLPGNPVYTVLRYDANGLSQIQEPNGENVSGAGRLTTVTVASDRTLRSIQDPDLLATSFTYDSALRLSAVIDRRGDTTSYQYDTTGSWKLAAIVGPTIQVDNGSGGTTAARPTAKFSPWQTKSLPAGSTSVTPKTPVATVDVSATITDPGQHSTVINVDRWGQPIKITDAVGGVTTIVRTGIFATATTYPSGAVDSARYTSDGLLVWQHLAGRDSTRWAYGSGFATPDSIWGPNQTARRMFLDSKGNITRVRMASSPGDTIAFYPDEWGRDTLVVDPLGHSTHYHFETTFGNVDSTLSPGGRYVATRFDQFGRDSITLGYGRSPTLALYDSMNRVRKVYAGAGADTVFLSYDPLFAVRVKDAKGQVYRDSVNALGWTTRVYDPADTLNSSVSYRYNADGQVTSVTNRRGQSLKMTYDGLHRLLSKNGDNVTADNYAYSTDQRVTVGWNSVSRDSMFTGSLGWTDSVVTILNGKRFRIWYRPTTTQLLDSMDIATTAGVAFHGTKFVWNMQTGVLSTARVNGETVNFGYDNEQKRDTTQWMVPDLARYDDYTSIHHRYQSSFSANQVDSAFYRGYHYDPLGRVDQVWTKAPSGINVAAFDFDSLGRLSSQNQSICGAIWGPTSDDGMRCAVGTVVGTPEEHAYDVAGNDTLYTPFSGTAIDATYAVGNRLLTFGTTQYTTDLDGNIVRKFDGARDIRYAWTADNRLAGDTVAGNGQVLEYDYNAFGQLVRRRRNGADDRYFLWDGDQLLAELDGALSRILAQYAYLPTTGQPLAIWRIFPGTAEYYLQDQLGSVTGLINGAAGVSQKLVYDSRGNLIPGQSIIDPSLGDRNRLRWKGLVWEGDSTQLYYVRERWYDPQAGRFMSEDPIGLAGGMNFYVYASGDPINGNDPSGLDADCCMDPVVVIGHPHDVIGPWDCPADAADMCADLFGSSSPVALAFWHAHNRQGGGGPRGRSGRGTGTKGQNACPTPPPHPSAADGGDVDANIQFLQNWSLISPATRLWTWANFVSSDGIWGFKSGSPAAEHNPNHWQDYQRFGNFNYGATGRTVGIPTAVLKFAANMLDLLRNHRPDEAQDQMDIENGARYANNFCHQ